MTLSRGAGRRGQMARPASCRSAPVATIVSPLLLDNETRARKRTGGAIKTEFRLTAEQTKGGHARTVFVSEKLRKELSADVKTLKRRDRASLALFGTQKRDSFTTNTLCQYFHWLYRRAGLEGASSHSGRRTFITNLASKGVGVRVLAALAGHCNPSTTMIYIDASDDMKRKAVELVF